MLMYYSSTVISTPPRQSIPASREIWFEKIFLVIFKPLISTTEFAVHQVQMIFEVSNKLASMRADILRNTAPSMPSSRQSDQRSSLLLSKAERQDKLKIFISN